MSIFNDFDAILSDYNKIEERFFLVKINAFAESNREVVFKSFSILLRSQKLNIQMKYLVLKSIGDLKYKEFVPLLGGMLEKEDKVRIVYEIVNSLVAIDTLPAYKMIVRFIRSHNGAAYIVHIEERLKDFFSKNKLIYHFDVFYRNRGDVKSIDLSSDFLIENLPEDNIKDILPAISSHYYKIRYEILRVLKNRPNPLYYAGIYTYFKKNAGEMDETLFLVLCEAMIVNASQSRVGKKVYPALKNHLRELEDVKRNILAIILLRLDTPDMMGFIRTFFQNLGVRWKLLVFDNLVIEEYKSYLDFVRVLLVEEDNEELLARVLEVLIYAGDYEHLFRVLEDERPLRKEMLLGLILEFDPPGIEEYLRYYIDPSRDNKILKLALEYIMRHAADDFYDMVGKVFFAGVSQNIKMLVARNLPRFSIENRQRFVETIFEDMGVVREFKKDFLFAMLAIMNEKKFTLQFEDKILNRVLIMLEESPADDIVNFIYFFDKYQLNSSSDMALVIEEFRMIQNTLLKSSDRGDLVRMIHVLIKNIEKRERLKAAQATGKKKEPAGVVNRGPAANKKSSPPRKNVHPGLTKKNGPSN
ncbi:MAG: hypothetical protein GY765_11655 [bacterium]|nr:hypothetical protein [bacterium]